MFIAPAAQPPARGKDRNPEEGCPPGPSLPPPRGNRRAGALVPYCRDEVQQEAVPAPGRPRGEGPAAGARGSLAPIPEIPTRRDRWAIDWPLTIAVATSVGGWHSGRIGGSQNCHVPPPGGNQHAFWLGLRATKNIECLALLKKNSKKQHQIGTPQKMTVTAKQHRHYRPDKNDGNKNARKKMTG